MSWVWPLTGRAEELRLISEISVTRDGPVGVVLAGPAGVGKTRLAREVLAGAERRGVRVRWVAATASSRALPLGPFVPLLDEAGTDPARLVQSGIDALVSDAATGTVMLAVDDAHLLDELSGFLVHQLALRRAAVLLLTLRMGETAPDAVTALWKDGHLRRLDLRPLSAPDTATLLEAVLGGPLDSADARRLWAITQGNALYLRHLFDGELDAGRLRRVAGVWRWSRSPALPPGLADLIHARIGRLTGAQLDVIDALAFAEPLGAPLLTRLTDRAAMEEVEARGLIEVRPDGRRQQVRLAHPLYGEVRRAACGRLRSRRWRGRIAVALADTGARRADDTLRRAVLMLGSDLPGDPALFTGAASLAVKMLDFALTERLARAAVRAGGGFAPRLLLGHALTCSGKGAEAEAELAALAELARTDADRAEVTITRVGNLFWTLAHPAEARSVLDEAGNAVGDPGAAGELAAMGAVLDAFLARPALAAATVERLAASPASPAMETLRGWASVTASGSLGRLDGLAEVVRRVEELADSYDAAQVRVGMFDMWIRALRFAGLLDAAEEFARRRYESTQDLPGVSYLFAAAIYGEVARDRGQVAAAIRLLRQAEAGIRGADPGGWSFCLPLRLTTALAMAGDLDGARRSMAELRDNIHPSLAFMEPDVGLARAWLAAAEGAVSDAVTLARQAADTAAAQGQPALEVYALHTAVRFGDRTVADRLAGLATRVDGPLAPQAAAHAAALAGDDGAALDAVSIRLEQTGATLAAADAAAHAATAHDRHGRRAAAHAASARAHALAERCPGARTPALVSATVPLPLTEREREIVTLAARGMTNRAIAERLVVSVRTVEGHIYRASAKLGTSNRAEFAALLGHRALR